MKTEQPKLSEREQALRKAAQDAAERVITRYMGEMVLAGAEQRWLLAAALYELMGETASQLIGLIGHSRTVVLMGQIIKAIAEDHPEIGVTILEGADALKSHHDRTGGKH